MTTVFENGRPDGMATLHARGIVCRFGARTVLDGVDLDVPAGRIVGLLGPNGAGKTTLMRVIFGVVDADGGTVMWDARPVSAEDRRTWGYMPQERGLYPDMRVIDLLVFFGRLHGMERRSAASSATALLERLDLGDRRRDDVKDLSGGMAQRVQLAAAMVHSPRLLVLDEPFAGLDPVATSFLVSVVKEHVRNGNHLLFSSHQLDLVEDICDTITLVDRGRVVLQGDLRDLKHQSSERFLRVDSDVDPRWIEPRIGAEIAGREAYGTRLRLDEGADAASVLDAVRRHAPVSDFAVEAPTLSELFLAAAGGGRRDDRGREFASPVM